MKNILTLLALLISNFVIGQSFFPTISGTCASDAPVELGTRFTTSANATITALRFYKCSTGTEVYTVKIYSGTTLLTSATYSGASAGWVNVSIPSVSIVPGVNYTVSYYTPTPRYQYINPYNGWPAKTGTLTATGSCYAYKATNNNTYPASANANSNYFADVVVKADTVVAPPPVPKDSIVVNGELYVKASTVKPCPPTVKDSTIYPFSVPDSSTVVNLNGVNYKYFYFTKYNTYTKNDTVFVPAKDTIHYYIAYGGLDTTDYKLYKYSFYKIREFTNFDGSRERYRTVIAEVIKHEEYDELTDTWIEK